MVKAAILSNVNINPITRLLSDELDVYKNEGYGNMIEELLNPNSPFNRFGADIIFILADISELSFSGVKPSEFFSAFEAALKKEKTYFVFDADERKPFIYGQEYKNEWNTRLYELVLKYKNVISAGLSEMVRCEGAKNFYSEKLWYLGRIVFGNRASRLLANEIKRLCKMAYGSRKKLLVLDLDNTLWGGVVGEDGKDGVLLSEEGTGRIYKDFQRILKKMKDLGVMLAIASKNNYEDAVLCINGNENMLLKEDDFVAKEINWHNKDNSIIKIAAELNIGLESIVFIDDSVAERELVKQALPMVAVPEFPKNIEDLPQFGYEVYKEYFEKLFVTKEDTEKTRQYIENEKRKAAEKEFVSFEAFLEGLKTEVILTDTLNNKERLFQLINKTNQFNLAANRYDYGEIENIVSDKSKLVYMFEVKDRFGEYGIISAVIVDIKGEPIITDFVMSCRTMGKLIENYIIDFVENDLYSRGFKRVFSIYRKTEKNKPVEKFYEGLGYRLVSEKNGVFEYLLEIEGKNKRVYYTI